jgi:F420-dependent oxidoreductase-like protein
MTTSLRVRIFVEPQLGATYDDQLAAATLTERLGFEGFFRSDHFVATADSDGLPGPTDCWVTLGALARETSQVRLGTMLTSATFRHPGLLAVTVAEVDAMSGGRVELGLGAGWFEREHLAYGVPFPATGERFDRLEEQLEIVKGLWETPVGGQYDFAGAHYRIQASPALPKPVQSPHPPLIVGGVGARRTPRIAARFADEFNVPPSRTPEETGVVFDHVRRACEEIGRDPSTLGLSAGVTVYCGTDQAEVTRRITSVGRDPETAAATSAAGTPEQVAARLRASIERGATTLYLQLLDLRDLDHIALLAAEVVPQLQ